MIWLLLFLLYLGYRILNNILYQDNQSAIKIEINRINACTGNSRQINIKYLFVKDTDDRSELKIEYFPTHEMLVGFFKKPL